MSNNPCTDEAFWTNSCYWSSRPLDVETRLKGQSTLCLPMRWAFHLVRLPRLQKNIIIVAASTAITAIQ